jgi:hypothetical protein
MGFRFRRSIGLLPGIRVNLGKRGASVSVGGRGAHVTIGPTGTRTTVGLPGTGLSYTHLEKPTAPDPAVSPEAPAPEPGSARRGRHWIWLLLIAGLVLYRMLASH